MGEDDVGTYPRTSCHKVAGDKVEITEESSLSATVSVNDKLTVKVVPRQMLFKTVIQKLDFLSYAQLIMDVKTKRAVSERCALKLFQRIKKGRNEIDAARAQAFKIGLLERRLQRMPVGSSVQRRLNVGPSISIHRRTNGYTLKFPNGVSVCGSIGDNFEWHIAMVVYVPHYDEAVFELSTLFLSSFYAFQNGRELAIETMADREFLAECLLREENPQISVLAGHYLQPRRLAA